MLCVTAKLLHCDVRKSSRGSSSCLQLTGSDCSDHVIKRKPSEIDLYVYISLLPVLAPTLLSLLALCSLSNVCNRTNLIRGQYIILGNLQVKKMFALIYECMLNLNIKPFFAYLSGLMEFSHILA